MKVWLFLRCFGILSPDEQTFAIVESLSWPKKDALKSSAHIRTNPHYDSKSMIKLDKNIIKINFENVEYFTESSFYFEPQCSSADKMEDFSHNFWNKFSSYNDYNFSDCLNIYFISLKSWSISFLIIDTFA